MGFQFLCLGKGIALQIICFTLTTAKASLRCRETIRAIMAVSPDKRKSITMVPRDTSKEGGQQQLFPPYVSSLRHPIANVSYYFVTSNISGGKSLRLVSERRPAFERVSSHVQSCLLPCAVVPRPAFAERHRARIGKA